MNKIRSFITLWLSRVILRTISPHFKTKLRNIEHLAVKMAETKSHRAFNECCLINNLLPTYTNISLHDEAARTESFTDEFRKNLVQRQVDEQAKKIEELDRELSEKKKEMEGAVQFELKIDAIWLFLQRVLDSKIFSLTEKHNRKLSNLYGGQVFMKEQRKSYLNYSNCVISPKIDKIFDLGMNNHLRSKYETICKNIDVEKLFRHIDENSKNKLISLGRLRYFNRKFKMKERAKIQRCIILYFLDVSTFLKVIISDTAHEKRKRNK